MRTIAVRVWKRDNTSNEMSIWQASDSLSYQLGIPAQSVERLLKNGQTLETKLAWWRAVKVPSNAG